MTLRSIFPPAQWLKEYNPKWLPKDLIAGITLAAYAVPVSLAYASLAGLPPQNGIYCYLIGGLFYALFGTSRQLAIGPTSAISMLVGVTVATMAGGDPARWISIAGLTAFVVAVMCIIAWALRLSTLISFISETILVGFKAGAAITIAMTQLPKLFGVPGGGEHFFEKVGTLLSQLGSTNIVVLCFGLVALVFLLLGEKILPGRPVALAVSCCIDCGRIHHFTDGTRNQGRWRNTSRFAPFRFAIASIARCRRRDSFGLCLFLTCVHRGDFGSSRNCRQA